MIPQISQAPGVVQLVLNFLQELEQQGFTGDTATSYADRLTMSTDNSIYQLLPDAVVFPRSTADVALIARLAAQERYSSLIFTPRGGGTGTNGQALNQGIIVDMSRYMNRIIEINPEEGWVRVEAGVIKDQLNQYLKPFGYFFAPELSTSNRATLGGMINTDASGQGSLVYGKTSDHVLGVRAVLLGGDILDTQPLPVELAETLGKSNTTIGRIYNTVYQRCRQQRQLIIDNFPKLNRFLTGYDLRHVFNDEMTEFDLTRILTGSEGTLAFITEARLDITPLPKVRRLVNVKYDSFDSALRNAPFMVEARALSVETVDSKVLNLAREDIVWHSVSELITDVPDKEMLGLNIVEFAGDDEALIEAFRSGADFHKYVASMVYKLPVDQITGDQRSHVKAMSYGLAYGLSTYGLAQQLKIAPREAEALKNRYFDTFGKVHDYLESLVANAREKGYTETIFGRRRYFPALHSTNRVAREAAERAALNAPIQGSAADIMKIAMIRAEQTLAEAHVKSRIILQIHDELVVEIAPGEGDQVTELVRNAMEHAVDLAVPLDVSCGIGSDWQLAAH